MTTLPKHVNAKPTLIHAEINLTIDGGDVRQDAMREVLAAMTVAFNDTANKFELDTALSRRLRSSSPAQLRRSLNKRGFRISG